MNSNATAISITLRSDAKFSDGTPVTASDVAFTLNRDEQIHAPDLQFIPDYKSTTIVNAHQLIIHLTRPNSLFLGGLCKIYILNKTQVEKHAGTDHGQAWLANHAAGSGPFTLAPGTNAQSGTVKVQRNPKYWGFNAKRPENITFKIYSSHNAQREALQQGSLDLATTLTPQDAKQIKSTQGLTTSALPVAEGMYLYFNMVKGPTTNLAVRQAMQLAYDYKGALKNIRGGIGTIDNGVLPTTFSCRISDPPYHQNIAEAKKILRDAHVSGLSLTLNYQTYDPLQVQEATLFQSNMKAIGINVKLSPITFAHFEQDLSQKSTIPQMFLAKEFSFFPDPGVMLESYYYGPSIGVSNRTGYDNASVNKDISNALSSPTQAGQCKYYKAAQQQIRNDAVTLSMYTLPLQVGYPTWLHGVTKVYNGSASPWIPSLRVG